MRAMKKAADAFADLKCDCETLPKDIAEMHDDSRVAFTMGAKWAVEEALKLKQPWGEFDEGGTIECVTVRDLENLLKD